MTSISRPIVKVEKNHTIEIKCVIQFTKCIYTYAFFQYAKDSVGLCRKWITGKE